MTDRPVDPTATRIEREFKHTSPLVGCRFDPTGRFLFAAAQDSTIQRFDLLTGAKTALTGHASWARAMAFLPAPAGSVETVQAARFAAAAGGVAGSIPKPPPITLVSGDYHGRLLAWRADVDTPTPFRAVPAHEGWVRAVAVSPDGTKVATCGNDHLVKLWSAADGALLRTFQGHDCHVYNVAFHPGGAALASADLKGTVKHWDLTTGACVRDLDGKALHKYDPTFRADIGGARGMAFDPSGGRLACAGITNVSNAFAGVGNPVVVVFDWMDAKPRLLKPKEAYQGTAWGVAFHPAGYVIAAGGGSGGRIWFWKGDDLVSLHTVTLPTHARDLALHPAGDRLAIAGANGTAIVYTLTKGQAK